MSEFTEVVKRGMDLIGDRWSEIDLDILNLGNVRYCVLGQLTGDYWSREADRLMGYTGPNAMLDFSDEADELARHEHATNLGFSAAPYGENGFEEYAALTSEWKRQLIAKREALV